MAISTPAKTQINVVATTFDHPAKTNLGTIRTGSYLTQASMLVYDDILRFQNSTPKNDIIDTLTAKQKKAIYAGIKTIYQPMYGVSGSPYYDETYFNLLKGYVGSYFYKEYPWFNTNDTLNIFEFAALNLGNALYQFIDAVWTDETIREAYNDYAEQGMGVYRAWQEQGNDSTYFVRDELKDKRIKINLWEDDGSGETGIVVYAGFDSKGELVVWDSASYPSLGTTADISRFNYNEFEGNILWFMDELVGMESDWIQDASPGIEGNTAYSYVQFTEESVKTAVNRYIGHLERFNARSLTRDWEPYSIKRGEKLPIPEWLTILKNSTKTHEEKLDALTYDEMLALAFVHLHSKDSKDSNFVLLSRGDIYASKELYKNNHHTNPDAATLTRMEKFWPWRKQNRYAAALANYSSTSIDKACAFGTTDGTPEKVIACIKAKLTPQDGDALYKNYGQAGYAVFDVTSQIDFVFNQYSDWHSSLINPPSGTDLNSLKCFELRDMVDPGQYGYFFYRENGHEIWLQNLKDELTNNASRYNFNELCNTIMSWTDIVPIYILDFWEDDISTAGPPEWQKPATWITPSPAYASPFGISNGFSDKNPHPVGSGQFNYVVIGMSTQRSVRGQFQTMFHEAGGHAMHKNWGYGPPFNITDTFLSRAQSDMMLKLYIDYDVVEKNKMNTLYPLGKVPSAYEDQVFWDLPMSNISALGLYGANYGYWIEDEFLARVYSMMAVNKCITFEKDIWSVMTAVNPEIGNKIIPLDIAKEIDKEMKNKMKLNLRTY